MLFFALLESLKDGETLIYSIFQGTFPMVFIWYIFIAIALQIHAFAMYFSQKLFEAWEPMKKRDWLIDFFSWERDQVLIEINVFKEIKMNQKLLIIGEWCFLGSIFSILEENIQLFRDLFFF